MTEKTRRKSLQAQLKAASLARESMAKKVCDSLYVDTIEEAYKVMDRHRNAEHVKELRDERAELEFIALRHIEIQAEIDADAAGTEAE